MYFAKGNCFLNSFINSSVLSTLLKIENRVFKKLKCPRMGWMDLEQFCLAKLVLAYKIILKVTSMILSLREFPLLLVQLTIIHHPCG